MAKPSWVTLSKSSGTGGGSVQVTASKNTGSSTRSGTLTVKTASGITKLISVSQRASIYNIYFRGSIIIKNQISDKDVIPHRLSLYAYLKNVDGDVSQKYLIGQSINSELPYGEIDSIEIELDQSFYYYDDQQPFDILYYLQLSTENGIDHLDGYTVGSISIEEQSGKHNFTEIVENYRMTLGRLDPANEMNIDISVSSATVKISNNLSTPLVITKYY